MEEKDYTSTDTCDLTDLSMFYHFDEQMFPAFLLHTGCRRFYVGSYFCEKYFVKSIRFFLHFAAEFLMNHDMRVTLVVPIAPGRMLDAVKDSLYRAVNEFPGLIDEVVVNDYGMLNTLQDLCAQVDGQLEQRGQTEAETGSGIQPGTIRRIAGRLFFRNYRDPRYGWGKDVAGRIFFPESLNGLIDAVDLDLVSEEMDFCAIPEEIGVHIHYPYVYATLSHSCEFASARLEDRMKFRTMLPCGNACMSGWYRTKAGDTEYLHFTKAVYVKGPENVTYSRKPDRFVYWPVDEFMQGQEKETVTASFS